MMCVGNHFYEIKVWDSEFLSGFDPKPKCGLQSWPTGLTSCRTPRLPWRAASWSTISVWRRDSAGLSFLLLYNKNIWVYLTVTIAVTYCSGGLHHATSSFTWYPSCSTFLAVLCSFPTGGQIKVSYLMSSAYSNDKLRGFVISFLRDQYCMAWRSNTLKSRINRLKHKQGLKKKEASAKSKCTFKV